MNQIKNNFWNSFYKIYISIFVIIVAIIVTLVSSIIFMGFGFVGESAIAFVSLFVAIATPIVSFVGLLKFNKSYKYNEPLSNFRKFIIIPVTAVSLITSVVLSVYFIFFW